MIISIIESIKMTSTSECASYVEKHTSEQKTIKIFNSSEVHLPVKISNYSHGKNNNKKDTISIIIGHGLGPKNPKTKDMNNDEWTPIILKGAENPLVPLKISVMFTARGHGTSTGWESSGEEDKEQFTWFRLSDDMKSIANTLQLENKVVYSGSSMGGASALYASIKYSSHVSGLIMVRPPTAWEERRQRRKNLLSSAKKCREEEERQGLGERHHLVLSGAALSDLPPLDSSAYSEIKCPVLILTVQGDDSHPVSTATALFGAIREGRTEEEKSKVVLHIADSKRQAENEWPLLISQFLESI
jgi:esterase/lipase